jgi:hypothetical protein
VDPVTVVVALAPLIGGGITLAGSWLQGRMARRSLQQHARQLPPGSRVIDLGGHGIVIEIGGRPAPVAGDE